LEIDMPGVSLFVEGDAGRLQQVFRNILSNAVKFTPSGGELRISVSREEGHATIAIADTGRGIEPEFLPFVFDMFQQQEQGTRREYQGLGIGMALVKRLTELHHGTVRVASAGTGQGTEVKVRLALAGVPDTQKNAPSCALPSATTLAGLDILVVEDGEDARKALGLILQGLGASVRVACDGREALDAMHDKVADLVLCDLRMPHMDGFEFMRELSQAAPSDRSPVVAVSSLASDADRERTREAGFKAHLKKPVEMSVLIESIETALGDRG
jgi:CheY-like chemotaxis protein/anti-sigma regulatory factor (Ser/Thr protein kinase)